MIWINLFQKENSFVCKVQGQQMGLCRTTVQLRISLTAMYGTFHG